MKNTRILNRAGKPPEDGWYDIEQQGIHDAGEWPDGRKRKQVLDEKAFAAILNRFASDKADAGDHWAGMLVDADHLSHDLDKSTEAFAWAQELRVKDGVLQARLEPTDIGDSAIRNRRYKFFSTEYEPEDLEDLGDGSVRPLRLGGLAFTNRPRKTGGKPILNRTGDKPGGNPTPQNQTMKSIAEKLGLPADADEAAILAKIATIMSENESLKGKDAEVQADAIMNRMGDRVPEAMRDSWRKRLIANRKDTEELMETTFPKKGETTPIFNRQGATAPEPVEGKEGDPSKPDPAEQKKAAAIRNRADTIAREQRIPFSQAFSRAQAELR